MKSHHQNRNFWIAVRISPSYDTLNEANSEAESEVLVVSIRNHWP